MTEPLFDSTRAALGFALNHHLALPRPLMNRMMADGRVRRIELADGTKITVAVPNGPPRSESLRGLDGAAQAGMICAQLATLPEPQQLILMATVLPAMDPCSCRAPCCVGTRPNAAWARAVMRICAHLKEEAQLSKVKGKKGLSTSPELRRALVEKFFLPRQEISLAALAERCNVTENTLHAHRRPIITYLAKTQEAAWVAIGEVFDESGIVGTIT